MITENDVEWLGTVEKILFKDINIGDVIFDDQQLFCVLDTSIDMSNSIYCLIRGQYINDTEEMFELQDEWNTEVSLVARFDIYNVEIN